MTTAVLLGLMLAFEPKEDDIMRRPPRDPKTPILTGELIGRILLVSGVMLVGAFGSFEWAVGQGYSDAFARTVSVNVFVMVELFYLFNCRSLTKSMFAIGRLLQPLDRCGGRQHGHAATCFYLRSTDEPRLPQRANRLGRVVANTVNRRGNVLDRGL